ncbi:hemolysin regulation protein AhpA [Chelonobacter oris]|uniref:Hemolysin regulation protein AhpA n=1 Tax=Chelonobacter oris TaxID=505317 RepID=A0A0A3APN9_9PAST|nr:YtjB family periplasmic protein [Chelonobacter oris]KGQ69702.1 hemolysin regulation protein AhpA [Chelonobacter oris]
MLYLNKEKVLKFALLLTIIVACAAIMSVILYGVKQFKVGSQLASINQVSYLSHTLVRQQANLMSVLLANNTKIESLVDSLDQFRLQEFVLDATVYSPQGNILAQSSHPFNVRARIGLDAGSAEDTENTQQIVEPIRSASRLLGYLRVTFDTQYGQTTQDKINALFHHLYGELIIVFLCGVVVTSSIHYFLRRRRKILVVDTARKSVVNKNAARPTHRFHSKRRRFLR